MNKQYWLKNKFLTPAHKKTNIAVGIKKIIEFAVYILPITYTGPKGASPGLSFLSSSETAKASALPNVFIFYIVIMQMYI